MGVFPRVHGHGEEDGGEGARVSCRLLGETNVLPQVFRLKNIATEKVGMNEPSFQHQPGACGEQRLLCPCHTKNLAVLQSGH